MAFVVAFPVVLPSISQADERPVGMTLLFQSAGYPVGVKRFDPDGMRGPAPGNVRGLAPRGGAEMMFLPDDRQLGIPKYVDIQWMVATPDYEKTWDGLARRADAYSPQWMREADALNAQAPRYTRRIDLTPIVTPELLAQVQAHPRSTQLKLVITFNNADVDVSAQAVRWR